MTRKINKLVSASGGTTSVSNASSMSDGKTYIRNPKNSSQILQVQSKEGDFYKCFVVTKKEGATITIDNTKAVYVHQETEIIAERI